MLPIWQALFWALRKWTYAILTTALCYNYPHFLVEENEEQKSNSPRVAQLVSKEVWIQTQVIGSRGRVHSPSMLLSPEIRAPILTMTLDKFALLSKHCTIICTWDLEMQTELLLWGAHCAPQEHTHLCQDLRGYRGHVSFIFGSFMRILTYS